MHTSGSQHLLRVLRKVTLIAALAAPFAAVAAPPTGAEYAAGAKTSFDVGTLHVQQYGDHGRPVILIPGLGGGAWVWKNTIEQLRGEHVVYAVTLAGFDGTPAPTGPGALFDRADAALLQLIQSRHLDKPVLVGHSLGGTLALRFAGEHADLLGGVVAVDGLPVFPGMERVAPAQRTAIVAGLVQKMGNASQEEYAAQQSQYMQQVGVIDPAMAAHYAPYNARSDKKATAQYMGEDAAGDWREGLKQAKLPILEITAYNAPDSSAGPMAMTQEQKIAYYRSLLVDAPNAKVVALAPSRHFIMLDQPVAFQKTLAQFLGTL